LAVPGKDATTIKAYIQNQEREDRDARTAASFRLTALAAQSFRPL